MDTPGRLKSLRDTLRAAGYRPKKALGQNFITDPNLLKAIVSDAGVTEHDTVLEVGAGSGWLTRIIASKAGHVVAVEIDRLLYDHCRDSLDDLENLTLLHADILETKNRLNADAVAAVTRRGGALKVVANLPFVISSPFVILLYESGLKPECVVLTLQKEVADRLVAEPGSDAYGLLTVLLAFFANARTVRQIPARMFWPPPEVDASVVRINARAEMPDCDYETYKRAARAVFGHRRKTLVAALRAGTGISADAARGAVAEAGLDPRERGESLSVDELCDLARVLP